MIATEVWDSDRKTTKNYQGEAELWARFTHINLVDIVL